MKAFLSTRWPDSTVLSGTDINVLEKILRTPCGVESTSALDAEREVRRVLDEAEPNVTPAPGLMFVMPWYGYHWRADWMGRPEREALAEAITKKLAEGAFDQ